MSISHRYSDPCLLESGAGIDYSKAGINFEIANRENDIVSEFSANHLSVQAGGESLYIPNGLDRSRSIDSWLANHLEDDQVEKDRDAEILKHTSKMEEIKKQIGKLVYKFSNSQHFRLGF